MFNEEEIKNIKEKAETLLIDRFSCGKDRDAELLATQILKIDPNNAKIIQLLGLLKHKQQDYNAALDYFKKSTLIEPNNFENYNNIGLCLSGLGKYNEAIEVLEKAKALRPDLDYIYSNLGLQYRSNKQIDKAIACFENALEIKESAESWSMLGGCYGEIRDLSKAESCFIAAIKLNKDSAAAHVDLASIYQFRGQWKEAWSEYEWRFKLYEQSKFWDFVFDPDKRLKCGQNINDKRILIHSEQGTGDMIHFFRYVKFMKQKGAYVILHCWESLKPLFESEVDEIYTKEPAEIPGYKYRDADFDMPIHDYHCSIISLPYILDMNFIPNDPYLKSTKNFNTEDYKDNFKIGIVWAGNPQHPNDKYRSCKLKDFKKIHDSPHVKLFNLQKDMRPRMYRFEDEPVDLTDGADNFKIVDASEFQKDYDYTASIIEAMDLIITVDTSILHLAGSLGKPTFALISWNGDWRWKLDGKKTEWYPSVKLFRQKNLNDWDYVFEEIYEEIMRSHENSLQN